MSVSPITLEKNKMTYIYDHSKGTIISDEKPELKDKKTRKPGAVPPKTNTIKMAPLPPINFDLIPKPFVRDPEIEAAEKRFLESMRRNEEEKRRNANSGLAGLMGGDPNIK